MNSTGNVRFRLAAAAVVALLFTPRPLHGWQGVAIPQMSSFQHSRIRRLEFSTSAIATSASDDHFPRHRRNGNSDRRRLRGPVSSSRLPVTCLNLLKGFVTGLDDDIRQELAESSMSLVDLFLRELEQSNFLTAIGVVLQRMNDKSGDYENKFDILSDNRNYGNRELIDKDRLNIAPTLDDLNQIEPSYIKTIWVQAPFRIAVLLGSYFCFPIVCNILSTLVDVSPDEFDIINEQFTPGIGILYGTFVALTLDILYDRQGKVQENASVEASLLSHVLQNILSLFRDDLVIAREATQIIADQVRIIVYRSRGAEMLSIMRSDPYARILSLVDHYHRDSTEFTPHKEAIIDSLRSDLPSLMEARAKRLSDEASSLPPTHFVVLLLLTFLSLTGFTGATLSITDENGRPPLESGLVFSALTAIYVLFFNFCKDLNDPFDGVYQIKRSSAASYLLKIKWVVANQEFGQDIKFDTRGLAPVYDGNVIVELGKEESLFEYPTKGEVEAVATKGKEAAATAAVRGAAEVSVTEEVTTSVQETLGTVTDAKPVATIPAVEKTSSLEAAPFISQQAASPFERGINGKSGAAKEVKGNYERLAHHQRPEVTASVQDSSGTVATTMNAKPVATTPAPGKTKSLETTSSISPQAALSLERGSEREYVTTKEVEGNDDRMAHHWRAPEIQEAVTNFQNLSGFCGDRSDHHAGPNGSSSSTSEINDNVRISPETELRGQSQLSMGSTVLLSSYFRSVSGFYYNQ